MRGDDFVSGGVKGSLTRLDKQFKKHFEAKTETLSPDPGEVQELRILSRALRWESGGISWEANQRRAELTVSQLDLGDSKPVTSAGTKDEERRETLTDCQTGAQARITERGRPDHVHRWLEQSREPG